MSRSFSVNDSKRLSDEHIKLKSAISAEAQQKELLREEIKKNTDFAVDEAVVDEFEKAPAGAVLPAQIQSGETGLNIQSASVVIICEPQFKPSIENQAISRAYRMGQTRNVLVYRILCENSVDERITEILKEKQNIFDAFADESSAAAESLEIDSVSFGNIIDEEIKRINKEHASEENKQ